MKNNISDFAHVSPFASIGEGNTICNGVVIHDNVYIGNNNYIGEYTTIGTPPEFKNEFKKGKVIIGSDNVIREYVAIQSPAKNDCTVIRNHCYVMEKTHIAHDCFLDDYVTLAPGVVLGGNIGIKANMGINSCVHPNLNIGKYTMIGMGAIVTKIVHDYQTVVNKSSAEVIGWNKKGMLKDMTEDEVEKIIKGITG